MKATGFDRGLRSPGLWLVLALGVSVLTAAAFASPKPPWERDFVGLWEGVDALDGSTVQVSLSDIEGDGVLELRQREGFYTVCFKEAPGSLRVAASSRAPASSPPRECWTSRHRCFVSTTTTS
jgi:hypothetical protein